MAEEHKTESGPDPRPRSARPDQRPTSADRFPVTLRILIDGNDASHRSATLQHLASANDASIEPLNLSDGQPVADWLVFSAGWFEGAPLRLEVVSLPLELREAVGRAPFLGADAVVFTTDCSDAELNAGAAVLATTGLVDRGGGEVNEGQLVVFAQPSPGTEPPSAESVLNALGAPAETPIVVTTNEGGGTRYGFALAVRHALERVRVQDQAGLPRRAPSTPQGFVKSVLHPEGQKAAEPAEPVPPTQDKAAEPAEPVPPTQKEAAEPVETARPIDPPVPAPAPAPPEARPAPAELKPQPTKAAPKPPARPSPKRPDPAQPIQAPEILRQPVDRAPEPAPKRPANPAKPRRPVPAPAPPGQRSVVSDKVAATPTQRPRPGAAPPPARASDRPAPPSASDSPSAPATDRPSRPSAARLSAAADSDPELDGTPLRQVRPSDPRAGSDSKLNHDLASSQEAGFRWRLPIAIIVVVMIIALVAFIVL